MTQLTEKIKVNDKALSIINNAKFSVIFYPTFGEADLILNDNGNEERFTLDRSNQKEYSDINDHLIIDKKKSIVYYGETRMNPYPVEII